MGRRLKWCSQHRRLPLCARAPMLATTVPVALTVAVLMGLMRLRPMRAGAGAVLAFGILVGAALLDAGGRDAVGPGRLLAADMAVAAPAVQPLEVPPPAPPLATGAVRLPSEPGAAPVPYDRVVRVAKGDTLMKLMVDAGVDRTDAHEAIAALRDVYDPRRLRAGQAVTLTYAGDPSGSGAGSLAGMRLSKSFDREAGAGRLADGRFEAFEIEKQLDMQIARASSTIRSSLFEEGAAEGVPARVMVELVRLFSFDLDFQRDIRNGDAFDILFERYRAEGSSIAHEGEIRYAALTIGGKTLKLYRFETADGDIGYYNAKGQSARKALLRTPVDGARLSSGFGMRRHPILGYSRMHRGIDFAAPTGTPIMAAGSGVVEFAGRKGGYGKYIRIRHNAEYSTAYAHLHGYARGIKRGERVRQGEVIGYVGSTGRSTGPHLHYEVLRAGSHINPMDLKLPSGIQLAGKDLERFHAARRAIENRLDRMPRSTLIAQADRPER